MARFRMRLAIVIAITLAACLAISTRHTVDAVALAQPVEDMDRVSSFIILFPFSSHSESNDRTSSVGARVFMSYCVCVFVCVYN